MLDFTPVNLVHNKITQRLVSMNEKESRNESTRKDVSADLIRPDSFKFEDIKISPQFILFFMMILQIFQLIILIICLFRGKA